MDIAHRLERLRNHLVTLGERPKPAESGGREAYAGFSDFSESTGSGERKPGATNPARQA